MPDITATLCTCWVVTTITTNEVLRFTDHDKSISIGGNDYSPIGSYTPSAINRTSDMATDNMELSVILFGANITKADLRAGKYDHATVEIFQVDWEALIKTRDLLKGQLGAVTMDGITGRVELYGQTNQLNQIIGEEYSPVCKADLFDARCKVEKLPSPLNWQTSSAYGLLDRAYELAGGRLDVVFEVSVAGTTGATEPAWDYTIGNTTNDGSVEWIARDIRVMTGAVSTTISPKRKFTSVDFDTPPAGWFTGGKLIWMTGANAGYQQDVKVHTSLSMPPAGVFEIYEPMPNDIVSGDTFTVEQGCDGLEQTCKEYNNFINNRAFYHVPGKIRLFERP